MSTSTASRVEDRPEGTDTPASKLGLPALIALVIGSMVGGGIFALPQQMAEAAAPGPIIIGWAITGLGMLCLAFVFQNLSNRRPDLDAGVYSYARAGLGNFMGTMSAWGYWISAWLGNVAYFVLLMATFGTWFGAFGNGETWTATIIASVVLWAYTALVLSGVRGAAIINTITTIAKIIPILLFIILTVVAFKMDVFTADFWGRSADLGSTMDQVKNMMMVTVWVFIGIEGASIFSKRAARRSDVGRATVLGFVVVLALLVLVNLLSFGIMDQARLAGLEDPSMAGVLSEAVGSWGANFIAIGLVVSLVGALLSWTLMCAEVMGVAAADGALPRVFARQNSKGTPVWALVVTSVCIQVFLLLNMAFPPGEDGTSLYNKFVYLATSMVLLPYLFSALYQVILTVTGRTYDSHESGAKGKDLVIGFIALIYTVWLVYAGGIDYLWTSALFYVVGIPFYIWARTERGRKVFASYELVIALVIVAAAGYAAVLLSQGKIAL